jgi:hypothetical protein
VRIIYLMTALVLVFAGVCFAQEKGLMIDDFEGAISGGPEGTVDYGAGNGSTVEVSASRDFKQSGAQALEVSFEAVNGGYMWIARGFALDAKNAGWLVKPTDIKWKDYRAISFYMLGTGSQTEIAFDLKDNGGELWRFMLTDNFKGWKQLVCKFADFVDRSDWQPDSADKNGQLDFPLKSYQWEPRPSAKGVLYLDDVELLK